MLCVFFFQAEDGIRGRDGWLEFRRVLVRSGPWVDKGWGIAGDDGVCVIVCLCRMLHVHAHVHVHVHVHVDVHVYVCVWVCVCDRVWAWVCGCVVADVEIGSASCRERV